MTSVESMTDSYSKIKITRVDRNRKRNRFDSEYKLNFVSVNY